MRQERRKHQRAQVPGMRVLYEDATGQRAEADALDVGGGGVFVRCDHPLPAGKGLSLELVLQDGSARLSVLGRVAWVRPEAAAAGPAGMGIRFLDAEPAVLARIEQLVAARERTEPGTGGAKTPAREPTVLGVGSAQTPQAAAPIIAVAPTREKTVLGVGSPEAAPRRTIRRGEPSLGVPPPEDGWESASDDRSAAEPESPPMPERSMPIELVTTKAKVEAPLPSEASLVAAGVPRRRSRMWPAVLVVLLAAGCAAYFFRARIPWVRSMIERGSGLIAPAQPVEAPPPAPSPQPLASTPVPSATPSGSTSASSAPVASASPSATAAAKSAPTPSVSAPAASAKPAKKSAPKPPPAQGSASKAVGNP
jgi:uncharacterized protein (TIGR02266 family)